MASKKVALGRGLGALFTGEGHLDPHAVVQDLTGRIFEIEISRIRRNPYQPRQDFGAESLQSLAQSISQLGIVQPVTVRATEDGDFELISGERRVRAAGMAGLRQVPAFIRVANVEQMLEMALVENVQREDLNPIEIALGYRQLLEECELTQDDVAQRVGKNRSTVANALRLLRLPPRIQHALKKRELSEGHARALLGLKGEEAQLQLFDQVQQRGLTVRQVERIVQRLGKAPGKKPKVHLREALQLREYENQLRTRFGTKVRLMADARGKGKVELHYFSREELTRVLELLLGQKG